MAGPLVWPRWPSSGMGLVNTLAAGVNWCPVPDLKNRAKNETLFFLTVFMTVFIFIY